MKLTAEVMNSSVIVTLEIWNMNTNKGLKEERFSSCAMLLDTGAFMTVIDRSLALRNGYQILTPNMLYEKSFVKGIGGRISADYAIIPNIRIDGIELGSIYTCVIDFSDDSSTNAILGLNFLREFKTIIDFKDKYNVDIDLEPKFNLHDICVGKMFNRYESRFGLYSIHNNN